MADQNPTASGSRAPRYASLEDYLNVVRRRWKLIAVVAVIGAVIGAASAASGSKSYTADASLSFRDISQDLTLLGVDAIPEVPSAIRAAVNAELVSRPQVSKRVAKKVKGGLSKDDLEAAIEARVGTQTQLVVLQAQADDPKLAAVIANAYAEQVKAIGSREVDRRLQRTKRSMLAELRDLDDEDPADATRRSLVEQRLLVVQTLLDVSEPVEIAQRATPPESADSPTAATAGVIGALIGLLFGILGAFGRDALDKRIRSAHEVQSELGLPVLGRIRESALGYPGLLDGGEAPIWDSDFESFRVLRTNLGFLAGGGELRALLVTSPQPEEGKTTVSMSLASAAAVAGQRALLIEGDLRRPSFARRSRLATAPGLSDYLRDDAGEDQIVQTVELRPPRPSVATSPTVAGSAEGPNAPAGRLDCVTAGSPGPDAAELLVSDRLERLLASLRASYELIVIDSSPMLSVVDPLQLIDHVDATLVCVRAHSATRDEVRAARGVLANLPPRPSCAVVTGLRSDGPDSYEYYYGY